MEATDLHPPGAVSTICVANAPCSYGAFEETIGVDPLVPGAIDVLDDVAAAGYAGIDLGPVGYLGDSLTMRRRLAERGLSLAGGYLPLTFDDHELMDAELSGLHALLDVFDQTETGAISPKPTLAGVNVPGRRLLSLAEQNARAGAWTDDGWRRYADGVAHAAEVCRTRGYEPTFHHHVGTAIETVAEIDRLLELTDVSLCLDTGHLAVIGADSGDALRRWSGRINHFHLKDADASAIAALVSARAHVTDIWQFAVFAPLGRGQLDCARILEELRESGYGGWLVVEQDILPQGDAMADRAREDQQTSRAFLKGCGL
jgi:inosose dehydratase